MKWKKLALFCVLVAIFILSLFFDSKIIALIFLMRNPFLDNIFSWIFYIEKDIIFYPLIVFVTLIIFLFQKKELQKNILLYFLSLAIVLTVSFVLKTVIARPRPISGNHSFPSGHAAMLFTSLPFLNKKAKIAWFVISCVFVFVRLWMGAHYFSDLIAGAMIGYHIPFFISNFISKKFKEYYNKQE